MFRFKKAGAFLSVLTVLSVVAGSFPIQAFTEVYTGELQLPNTVVVSDYGRAAGGGQVTMSRFNNGYFPSEPIFTARESNNFMTSLPQRVFSASIDNYGVGSGLVFNCTNGDININPSNNGIILTGVGSYSTGETDYTYPFLCQPTPSYPYATPNTVLTNTGSGNSYNGLGVVQTYDLLPFAALGESAQNTTVESIPNDPNNVRVTVSENVIRESYGLQFERRGDVERILNGDYTRFLGDYAVYKDGKTYVMNWLSNWVGQIGIPLNDDYGTIIWADPSTANYDGDTGRTTYDPLFVNTGDPTPQIVQLASIAPTLVSSSVIRPRNSVIVSNTQPQITRWSTCSFWRGCTQHMYAIKYELSADGRTGRGIIYQSWDTGGGFREFVGAALLVAGLAFGAQFAGSLISTVSEQMVAIQSAVEIAAEQGVTLVVDNAALANVFGETLVSQLTPLNVSLSAANTVAINEINAFTAGAVAAIAGATALGTVEQQIASSGVEGQEGVWIWTWSQAPGYTPGGNPVCANGATDYPTCTPPPGTCPNGATNYPICTITIIDRLFCTDPNATNVGGALPCEYTPGAKCQDPAAVNFNGALPCRYGRTSCPANSSYCGTGASTGKLCQRIYGSAPQCSFTESCNPCASGCSGNACAPLPPSPNITSWQVAPLLVRSGESTFVSWSATDVSDCTVSGTNNKSWNGRTGTRERSNPIFGQTVFSISCAALAGASPATVSTSSKTVNIIPTFQEQ